MAESLPLGSDGSALNEKVVPAAVRSFFATSRITSTDVTQNGFYPEDGASQQLDANGNGRAGVSTRHNEDERGVQQPNQADDMELEHNQENLNGKTYPVDLGGASGEPALTPSAEHPSVRQTTPQATPPPAPAAALLPPTILPAICQLLLVYIQRAAIMTPIQQPTDTAADPSAAGQEAHGQEPPQQSTQISAAQQPPDGIDPPVLIAVRQLRIFDIPATLLLQAAAHLMVVGAILPAHYKAVQAELAQHVLPVLPGASPPRAECAAGPPAAMAVVATAAAPSDPVSATAVPTDPPAHAAVPGGPERTAGVDGQVGGEAGVAACARGMTLAVTPEPPGPSAYAITATGDLGAGNRPRIGHVGAHAPTDAVASVWVGQGAKPSSRRLGLGRRLFTAIAEQLPKHTELDSILPPLYGYSGVLYTIMGSDDVGAALWDGSMLRDLGSYSTAADARQSMLMTTRLVAAAAVVAIAPAPRPKLAAELGKVAPREVAVQDPAVMAATTAGLTAAADEETGGSAEAGVSTRAGARATSEQGRDPVEPEVAEAAEQLLLLRMAQEAAPFQALGAGRLPAGPQSKSQSQPQDREQRQQRQSNSEDKGEVQVAHPQQPVRLPLEQAVVQSPLQKQQPGSAAVAATAASAALRMSGEGQANAGIAARGSEGPHPRATSEDVQRPASRLLAAAVVGAGGTADASTPVAMAVDTAAAAPVASPRYPRGTLQAAQQPGPSTAAGARPRVAMAPPGEPSPRLLSRADAAAGAAALANPSPTQVPPARNPVIGPCHDSPSQSEPLPRTSNTRMLAMSAGGTGSAGSRTQVQRDSLQQQQLQQMQQSQHLRYQQQKLQQQKQRQEEYQQRLQHLHQSQHQQERPGSVNFESATAAATAAGARAPAAVRNAPGAATGMGAEFTATRKRLPQPEGPGGRLVHPDSPHAVSISAEPGFAGAGATAAPSGKATVANTVTAGTVGTDNVLPDSGAASAADREGQLLLDLLSRSQSLPSDLSREALAVLINSTEGLAALLALLQRAKPQPQSQHQATASRGFPDGDPVPSASPMASAPTERRLHPEEEEEWATAAASQKLRGWGEAAPVAPPRRRYYAARPHAEHAPAIMSQPSQQAHQQQLHHGRVDPGPQAAAHAYELLPMQRVFRMRCGTGLGNGNETSRKYRDELLMLSLADDMREASCGGSAGSAGITKRPGVPRTYSDAAASVDGEPSPTVHEAVLVLGPRGCGGVGPEQQRGGDGVGAVSRSQLPWTVTQRNGSGSGGGGGRGFGRIPVEDLEPELPQGPAGGASEAPSGLDVGGGGLLLMQTPGGYTALHGAAAGRVAASAAGGAAVDTPAYHGIDGPGAGAGGVEGRRISNDTTAPFSAAATSQLLARSTLMRSGPSGDSGGGGVPRYGPISEISDGDNARMPRRRYPQDHPPVLGDGSGGGSVYQQGAMGFADCAQRPLPPNVPQPMSRPVARELKPGMRGFGQFVSGSDGRGGGDCVGSICHGRSAGAAYRSHVTDTTLARYSAQHQRQISTPLPPYVASHVDFEASLDECGRLQGYEPAPEASGGECEGGGGSAATAAPGGAVRVRLGDAISDETTSTDVSGHGNIAGGRHGGDGGNMGADVRPQLKRPRHAHTQSSREYGGVTNLVGLGIQEALALIQRHGTQL
ncbi:hypothetical protein Vretimale_13818 [Volvox reticuliferus]|uniref:Uncharacterized protein n=1 Tax=Volvox reticuliferus TaxID=1737510 RepID=A0A8J4GM23_9CHLO|nr:hypothetical protein Vretifemale_14568 [Volvox reticuliferus]GIM10038.1 hypothetical protein Vretimale_13818 [Volvox reticuliferus]